MKIRMIMLTLGFLVLTAMALAVATYPTSAQANADCEILQTGAIPNLTSTDISFTCNEANVVYFGACDSGNVPNDDLFVINFNGAIVSANYFSGSGEFVSIGSAQADAGANSAKLESTNPGQVAPATYSYAISTNRSTVVDYLSSFCGADFAGAAPPSNCVYGPRNVPVFTQDVAPVDGTLEFRIMLGNENSRETSGLMQSWELKAGQRLNNAMVTQLPAPRWARLWWQPSGADAWYLLPSQYWSGDGTTKSEYGIECTEAGQPSYHTAFASAVPDRFVCFDLMNGCK